MSAFVLYYRQVTCSKVCLKYDIDACLLKEDISVKIITRPVLRNANQISMRAPGGLNASNLSRLPRRAYETRLSL